MATKRDKGANRGGDTEIVITAIDLGGHLSRPSVTPMIRRMLLGGLQGGGEGGRRT